ncbi:MAG: DUF4410 domain-containing protein [Acidobacteriota bacterium]
MRPLVSCRRSVVLLILPLLALVACAPEPPTIDGIEPASGPSGGGTEVVVVGSGFQIGTQVMVGDRDAEVVSLGADGLSVNIRVPGGVPGPRPVHARIQDGELGVSNASFTYEALQVVETWPAAGAELASNEVPETIEVVFSQDIASDGASLAIEGVEGETAYDAESRTLSFRPAAPLAAGADYSVKISGVRDTAGNGLEAEGPSFQIAAAPKPAARATGRRSAAGGTVYDDGELQTGWFGVADLPWVDSRRLDYLWVRDGFRIDGRTFHFRRWEPPTFLGENAHKRDDEDRRLARQINGTVHEVFAEILGETWRGKAKTSTRGGDVIVTGRIVSCSTGNRTAKVLVGFGAGSGHITFDLKFTDASTGRLLAAIHHRTLSSSAWTTTDSRFTQWVERLGKAVDKKGFAELYADGDRVDD